MTAPQSRSIMDARPVTNGVRALLGFLVGLAFMTVAVSIFFTSNFDFEAILAGVRAILGVVNPWSPTVNLPDYYNPPHTALLLWPMLFITPKILVTVGGTLLMAVALYQKTWVELALALAIVSQEPYDDRDTIAIGDFAWWQVRRLRQ